ncbi:hypothetical protein PPL_11348 [Heterostelium album PN500]|uniref:Uncharacterized protein n=1 Tax=Heterostelium pallidum (strain ATCC 26659 / Pp 5 / PN500) TaxID=670386 RepID=D3BT56_HETP5|nr:hypothetical protein PPL_11348 [Heterostelium album PN500]EFA75273.1 hypothetical protein PPL_11348 [Heterostelium album PN500]|eukprot:XP_020427407.1 hypothetical protein PPL_11348 [Heterostelium album PN500]
MKETFDSLTVLLKDADCPSIKPEILLKKGFDTLSSINNYLKNHFSVLIELGFEPGDLSKLEVYLRNKESDLKFTAPCTPFSIYKSLSIHPKSAIIIEKDKEGEEKYIREDQQMQPGEYHIVEVHDSFSVKLLWWKKEIQISKYFAKQNLEGENLFNSSCNDRSNSNYHSQIRKRVVNHMVNTVVQE